MQKALKIQIVSRYLPIENASGNSAYVLDFINYLCQIGCQIECLVLYPSPYGKVPWCVVPPTLRKNAKVVARNSLRIGSILLKYRTVPEYLAGLQRLLNKRLPKKLKERLFFNKKLKQILTQLLPSINLGVLPWDSFPSNEEITFASAQFARFKPDVVIANYAYLGSMLDILVPDESVLKVILTHDILHERVAKYKAASTNSEIGDWNWDKESTQLRKAQILLAIQEEEAKTLKRMAPSSEVVCMPMSAVSHFHNSEKQIAGRCLFVGSSSPHNAYSIQWFLEKVWPLILQSLPHSSLHICGSVNDQFEGNFPNVRFLGRIPDLEPEYGAAQVCLVPLMVGSGLKIKLLEALSHGRSCVSTSIGIQGLTDVTSHGVIVADAAEDFAASVCMLLSHPDKRQYLEQQAHKYVTERFSPEATYQPFITRIHKHLNQEAS